MLAKLNTISEEEDECVLDSIASLSLLRSKAAKDMFSMVHWTGPIYVL